MKRRFTLIELMVVIAIITILSGMLLPVFSKSREGAKGLLCINNQKQCAVAMMIYAQDNQEIIPLYAYTSTSGSLRRWINFIVDGGNYLSSMNSIVCPGEIPYKFDSRSNYLSYCYGGLRDYNEGSGTQAAIFIPSIYAAEPSGRARFIAVNRLRKPSDCFLITDSWGSTFISQSYFITFYGGGSTSLVHQRHREMANAVFADGHASACSKIMFKQFGALTYFDKNKNVRNY